MTREVWDLQAATFDDEPDHGLDRAEIRDAWRKLLVASLPAAPARVADLGCGTGTLAQLLTEEGYTVDGVDFSPKMIERDRLRRRHRWIVTRQVVGLGDNSGDIAVRSPGELRAVITSGSRGPTLGLPRATRG